uniref:Ig-like domain-containing protein n=1 Tax=Salmo trutta TaxID=8032 RepID=A0A674CAQ6_SALTR
MNLSVTIVVLTAVVCTSAEIPHETVYVLGCLEKTKVEAELQLDGEEVVYADFQSGQEVWTLPEFLGPFPSSSTRMPLKWLYSPPDAPESTIYPRAEEELGVENTLICFANHFYPPPVKVNWTKNGLEVTEGASLSRYYPNEDGTFHQFSSLSFTPQEGDVYGCTVEHTALEDPKTRFWEYEVREVSGSSAGPAVFCGVGLTGTVGSGYRNIPVRQWTTVQLNCDIY